MDLKDVEFRYDYLGNILDAKYEDSTYRTTIPDYNIITDEDSQMVVDAKQKVQREQYNTIFFNN